MALSNLNHLYRAVILEHAQHPHHHGPLPGATDKIELHNTSCGDVIVLELMIEKNRITQANFSGYGCMISQASASMMTDVIMGKFLSQAMEMNAEFSLLVQNKLDTDHDHLGDAALLGGVAKFPARIKCATLPWKALAEIIAEKGDQVDG